MLLWIEVTLGAFPAAVVCEYPGRFHLTGCSSFSLRCRHRAWSTSSELVIFLDCIPFLRIVSNLVRAQVPMWEVSGGSFCVRSHNDLEPNLDIAIPNSAPPFMPCTNPHFPFLCLNKRRRGFQLRITVKMTDILANMETHSFPKHIPLAIRDHRVFQLTYPIIMMFN